MRQLEIQGCAAEDEDLDPTADLPGSAADRSNLLLGSIGRRLEDANWH